MPEPSTSAGAMLKKLEKLVKKVIRKSLKDNTLEYTVQLTMSSIEPGKIKYACQISSPANGIQPITFIFDTYKDLENALIVAEKELNKDKVEIAFHESRINTLTNKIEAHKDRIKKIEAGEVEEEENIPMEIIS